MLGQILRPWAAVATSRHLGKLSSSRSPPARCLPNSKTQQEGRHSGTAAQHPAGVRPHGSPPTTGHRPPRVTAQVTGQRAAWAADGEVEATTAPGWGTSQSTSPHYSQCPTLRTDPAPTRHGHRQPRVGSAGNGNATTLLPRAPDPGMGVDPAAASVHSALALQDKPAVGG